VKVEVYEAYVASKCPPWKYFMIAKKECNDCYT